MTTTPFPIEPWVIMALVAVELAMMLLLIAAWWRIFEKAGEPGWAAIVPIYNGLVALKIAGKPMWWIVLLLIPIVGFVFGLIVIFSIARRFGKGAGFALGMIFLFPIFDPLLAWGGRAVQPAGGVITAVASAYFASTFCDASSTSRHSPSTFAISVPTTWWPW